MSDPLNFMPQIIFILFAIFILYMTIFSIKKAGAKNKKNLEELANKLGGEVAVMNLQKDLANFGGVPQDAQSQINMMKTQNSGLMKLAAKISTALGMSYVKINKYEHEVRINLQQGGKNTPPYLRISYMLPSGVKVKIKQKGATDKFAMKLGMMKSIPTGDMYFDEKFVVQSDNPQNASLFLDNAKRREIAQYFFDNGFGELSAEAQGFVASKPNYTDTDLAPELINSHIAQLREFAGERN